MIDSIQAYLEGKNKDFSGLVGALEGALDAGEFRDGELVTRWYDFWTPLETRRAVEGNNITRSEAIKELESMKRFLSIQVQSESSDS
jgi:hypothetical protein